MPWCLPWSTSPLQTALLWEVAVACSLREQVVLRQATIAIEKAGKEPFSSPEPRAARSFRSLYDALITDLSRVTPRPQVAIHGPPLSDSADKDALEALAAAARLELGYHDLPKQSGTVAALAARRLLSAFGIVNEALRAELLLSARGAGVPNLENELVSLFREGGAGPFAFYVSSDSIDATLKPVVSAFAPQLSYETVFDWFGLGLPVLAQEIFARPGLYLEEFQRRLHKDQETSANSLRLRVSLLRHFVACLPPSHTYRARLDYAEATLSVTGKRPDRALELLERYVDSPPDDHVLNAHILGQAGRAAARLGMPARALSLYEANLVCIPLAFAAGSNSAKRAKAELTHKMGQLLREHPELPGGRQRALQLLTESLDLQKLLGMEKGVAMCHCELGQLSLEEGSLDDAEKQFQKALETDETRGSQDGVAVDLHGLAKVYEQKGNLQNAISLLDRVQAIHQTIPRVPPAIRNQVQNTRERIEQRLGIREVLSLESLLQKLDTFKAEDDRGFSTWLRQNASALREAGQLAHAETFLRAGLKKVVTSDSKAHITIALGNLLLDARRHDEAQSLLESVNSPNSTLAAEAALVMGRLFMQTGETEKAEKCVDGLLVAGASDETLGRAYLLRGRIFLSRGQLQEAAAEFVLARKFSTDSAVALVGLLELQTRVALAAGNFAEAEAFARESLALAEHRGHAVRRIKPHILLGDSLFFQGHFAAAAQQFELAINCYEVDAANPGTLRTTALRRAAIAWSRTGDSKRALVHIQEAVSLADKGETAPEQSGWIYQLAAYLYRMSGQLSQFQQLLEKAEEAADLCDDDRLKNALLIMRAGDLRSDNILTEMPAQELQSESTASALLQARLLRRRRQYAEALRSADVAERLARGSSQQRSCIELRVAIMLDMQEAGQRVALEPILAQLRDGRSDADLPPGTLTLLSRAAMVGGNYQQAFQLAEQAYQRAVVQRQFLTMSRAAALLSKALSEFAQAEQGRKILRELAAFMLQNGRLQQAFDAYYSICRQLIDERDLAAATAELQRLEANFPDVHLEDKTRLESARAELERIENRPLDAKKRLLVMIERVESEGRPELRPALDRQLSSILVDIGDLQAANRHRAHFEQTSLKQRLKAPARNKTNLALGHDRDALEQAEAEVERLSEAPPTASFAIAVHQLARAQLKMGLLEVGKTRALEALQLHQQFKKGGIPGCQVTIAQILARQNLYGEACAYVEAALAQNQARGDQKGMEICTTLLKRCRRGGAAPVGPAGDKAYMMLSQAHALRRAGKKREAEALFPQILARAREEKDQRSEAMVLGALGKTALAAGKIDDAAAYLGDAVALHRNLRTKHLAECCLDLSRVLERKGRRSEALAVATEGLSQAMDGPIKANLAQAVKRLSSAGARFYGN